MGIGPGAHSYVAATGAGSAVTSPEDARVGVRWWNVKHPRRYAALLEAGTSPAAGRELLTRAEGRLEQAMLGVRLREGLDLAVLSRPAGVRSPGSSRPGSSTAARRSPAVPC